MPKKAELGCCAAWRSLLWDFQSAVWCGRHKPGQSYASGSGSTMSFGLPHEAKSLLKGSLLCCEASKVLTARLQYAQQSLSGSDRASCPGLCLAPTAIWHALAWGVHPASLARPCVPTSVPLPYRQRNSCELLATTGVAAQLKSCAHASSASRLASSEPTTCLWANVRRTGSSKGRRLHSCALPCVYVYQYLPLAYTWSMLFFCRCPTHQWS